MYPFLPRASRRLSIYVRSLTRSYYPSPISRECSMEWYSLSTVGRIHRRSKKKRKKKANALSTHRWNILLLAAKKMTSNIRTRLEAVVLRLVGTLGYDLSRIHRYSKLFETWGTSVGEFPIAAPYSRSNTNVRLRVESIVLVTAEIATSPAARVSIGRIEVDTLTEEAYDRFYWPSLNFRKLLSRLHNHLRNLRQTIRLGWYWSYRQIF